ncbi:hypothetical protein ABTZ59_34505 [Streptomyces sp. NPDC094034]|uniref:hypothetical protein n=1 Tax=Streptomyces sp. NPDC094034 TaxID=3155309 RepID=UPI00332D0163
MSVVWAVWRLPATRQDMMSARHLRERCRKIIDGLEISRPLDVTALCVRIGNQRGRPVRLVPLDMPVSLSGLWLSIADYDAILYESRTSKVHQDHIILHEIGHLLAEHNATPAIEDEVLRLLMPNVDPQMIRAMLGRTRYSNPEEQEAELIASLLLERAGRWRPLKKWTPRPTTAAIARRLEQSLEERQDLG